MCWGERASSPRARIHALDVADDTDDRAHRVIAAKRHAMANRTASWPMQGRKHFVDHDGCGCVFLIAAVKKTAVDELRADGRKVVHSTDTDKRVLWTSGVASLDREPARVPDRSERRNGDICGVGHSGQALDAGNHSLEEADPILMLRIFRQWNRGSERQQLRRLEAEVGPAQICERPQQQTCADEQDDGHGDLADDECIPRHARRRQPRTSGLLQILDERAAGCVQRWTKAEREAVTTPTQVVTTSKSTTVPS